jgi:hypothetical protein
VTRRNFLRHNGKSKANQWRGDIQIAQTVGIEIDTARSSLTINGVGNSGSGGANVNVSGYDYEHLLSVPLKRRGSEPVFGRALCHIYGCCRREIKRARKFDAGEIHSSRAWFSHRVERMREQLP